VTRRLCDSVRMPPKSKNVRKGKDATSLFVSSPKALQGRRYKEARPKIQRALQVAAGAQIDLEKLALTDTSMAVAQALVAQNGAKAATLSLRAASRVSGGALSGAQ